MTTTERLKYIESYSYLLCYSAEQHLLENDESLVCTACSGSGIYDTTNSPPCGCCKGKGYQTKGEQDEERDSYS